MSGLLAHGGLGGAIVEGMLVISILAIFLAVWQRSGTAPEDKRQPDRDA